MAWRQHTGQPWRCATAIGLWLLGVSSGAQASDLEVRMNANQRNVRVGETVEVQLSVTRSGTHSIPGRGEVPLPELPGDVEEAFEVANCMPGVRTSIDMFRGQRQQTRTLDCVLVAEKPGEFSLGFAIEDGGQRVQSNVVEVRVSEGGASLPSDTADEGVSPAVLERLRQQGLAVVANVDKATAYVGEQITYRLDLYEARNFLDPHFRSPPSFKDFLTHELPVEEPTVESAGGMRFRVRPGIRRALFAQRSGTLEIGGAEIAIGMRGRQRSAPIAIEVRPLPAEGQPPGFSPNNVGQYTLRAEVDRNRVDVGEPFTYRLVLQGTGNIEVVDPGSWVQPEGVRRYDPKVETVLDGGPQMGGERRYTFLMIPQSAGTVTLPAQTFTYFDPAREAYAKAKAEPITVEVVGDAGIAADASIAAPSEAAEALPGAEGLAPIIAAETVPRREPPSRWLTPRRWSYGMAAVPVLALLGFSAGAVWRRVGPDDLARARGRARRRRRELQLQAERAIASGEGFHAAVAALLHEIAVERAGPEGIGLPRPRLLALLERKGLSAEDRRELERLLDTCDAARFGAARGSEAERRALLEDALSLARGAGFGGGLR